MRSVATTGCTLDALYTPRKIAEAKRLPMRVRMSFRLPLRDGEAALAAWPVNAQGVHAAGFRFNMASANDMLFYAV